MKAALVIVAALGVLGVAATAHAGNRYALVVGANTGDPQEPQLRYAESDAQRLAAVLRSVGGFAPDDVAVLAGASADQLRRALTTLDARIRRGGGDALLLVFYSGHADGSALHLGGTRLGLAELRDRVAASSAATRLMVIDACQSGALTRAKGGRPGPSFAVAPPPLPNGARGLAILASSAAGENAQESDALRSSFFTHYFLSALRGAADENRDGRITLSEAYAYASDRTLAATSGSREGPQHPTYRFELSGHDEVVLTQLTAVGRLGLLQFDAPGEYFVKDAASGALVAEIALARGASRQVVVGEGRYEVSRRGADHLLQGTFDVRRGAATSVELGDMQRVAYARVVRKGGTPETFARSVYTVGGVRGSLLGLGTSWQAAVGARLDLAALSLEVRAHGGLAETVNERLAIDSRELGTSVIALRAFDLGPITLGAGLELGAFWLAQRFGEPQTPDRDTFGAELGPIGVVEAPIGRWYLRAELAALTYMMRAGNDAGTMETSTPLTFRGGLGLGAYF